MNWPCLFEVVTPPVSLAAASVTAWSAPGSTLNATVVGMDTDSVVALMVPVSVVSVPSRAMVPSSVAAAPVLSWVACSEPA